MSACMKNKQLEPVFSTIHLLNVMIVSLFAMLVTINAKGETTMTKQQPKRHSIILTPAQVEALEVILREERAKNPNSKKPTLHGIARNMVNVGLRMTKQQHTMKGSAE